VLKVKAMGLDADVVSQPDKSSAENPTDGSPL
jgi:hypothetical protein